MDWQKLSFLKGTNMISALIYVELTLLVFLPSTESLMSPLSISRRAGGGFQIGNAVRRDPFHTSDPVSSSQLHMKPRLLMHPHSNLAVTIDQPLLPRNNRGIIQAILSVLLSDIAKAAVIAFCIAFTLSVVIPRRGYLTASLGDLVRFLKGTILRFWDNVRFVKGTTLRVWDKLAPTKEGVPMEFSETENDGWGVCTLRSKRRLGKTSYVQYDFDLPHSNHVLPLRLGQRLSLCCLDNAGSVAKGDFYAYYPRVNSKLGSFSIVAPNKSLSENENEMGGEAAHFVSVLKEDLKVGDEVAVRPGERKLEYRGKHFPVTDMVYIASGVGIVPILEQVRAVLPNGSSSVKSVSVVWVDETSEEFDVIADQLEREYFKHRTKLAVSCVVDNLNVNTLADNMEIVNAIPDFTAGTMAVLSGPRPMIKKAIRYLASRGYPEDVICEL